MKTRTGRIVGALFGLVCFGATATAWAGTGWTATVYITKIKAVNSGGVYVWIENSQGEQVDPCANILGNTRNYAFAADESGGRNVASLLTSALLANKEVKLKVTATAGGNTACDLEEVELYP